MQFDGKLPCEVICLPLFSVLSKSGQVRNFDKCKFFCVPCVSIELPSTSPICTAKLSVSNIGVSSLFCGKSKACLNFFAEMLLQSFILSCMDGKNHSNFHAPYTILFK